MTKKLILSQDKKLSGLCAGIAEYADVNPTFVRWLVVVFTVVTGFLPLMIHYVIASLVLSRNPDGVRVTGRHAVS